MKRYLLSFLGGWTLIGAVSCLLTAGEIDLLLKKLVDKQVLTPGEAQEIGTETKEEVKKNFAKGTYSSAPSWVQNMRMKGDLRVRYQLNEKEGSVDRSRGRLRLRLSAETRMSGSFYAGFGLSTGVRKAKVTGTDPAGDGSTITSTGDTYDGESRSTNATFQDTFNKEALMVDYGYISYMLVSFSKFDIGKIKNPIWQPTDLLWDTDLNPDGAASVTSYSMNDRLILLLNCAYFIIDELSSIKSDPGMFVAQPGFSWKATSSINVKIAEAVYKTNVKDVALDNNAGTNTLQNGVLKYEYHAVNPSGEITIGNMPLVNNFGVMGDYVKTSEPSEKNVGYAFGGKIGAGKVAGFGQWQAKYINRMLKKDAWLDTFPDSDSYSGKTNIKGHEVILEIGLSPNTYLSFDWYYTHNLASVSNTLNSSGRMQEKILQVDVIAQF